MNLQKMFEMQKALDERIIKEKGLEGQDLLPNLILALQVELAECANEWRGFKHWSNDREPRICVIDKKGQTAKEYYKNPLLEEYVDCLHFILSIGNRIGYAHENLGKWTDFTIVNQFNHLFGYASDLYKAIHEDWFEEKLFDTYDEFFAGFIGLGKMFGLTHEQIEAAYMEKNAVNHQRQQEGY
ncbi:dUTP diphosphatase [Bacillus sp. XT-2]|uniref:dUTP diphosphatase n=1 Tax=Bacillus sp. XT-2 TaxID=2856852 RepID=UPI0021E1A21B|nr:dUTP diphosphatase [Bacillus sp. XT-2]MCV0023434.1 dUTP diphosphatase [Bacillus sp. XT-2]MCV0025721.1 dUTP diphosphatase [Bacillus sp. XT-2]